MSALPTRADLAGTPTRAELQTILLAMYDMVAQRLAAGTTGSGAASGAELLLAQQSLNLEPGVDVVGPGVDNLITRLSGLTTALSIDQGGTGGLNANAARANLLQLPPVRQTVLSGPVDSNGLPNFGGSTGSTTVTASGTLVPASANGVSGDRIGSATNPSWTGLSTDGSMYLYLDIAADGTCTAGSTTLAPTYREGGADVTTNNQFTFNIGEMSGKVGNGSVATQTHRVFVGEVTVAGNVVTAITWYALKGRYQSSSSSTPSTTRISFNHNIGAIPERFRVTMVNVSTELGYAVGNEIDIAGVMDAAQTCTALASIDNKLTLGIIGKSSWGYAYHKTTGALSLIAAAKWNTKVYVDRGW